MRARLQRSHDRHTRVAAKLRKKKGSFQEVSVTEKGQENITSSSESEIPNLPTVPDSCSLTCTTNSTFESFPGIGDVSTDDADSLPLHPVNVTRKIRNFARKRGSVSDSSLTTSCPKDYTRHTSGHISDTATELTMVEQKRGLTSKNKTLRVPNLRRSVTSENVLVPKKPVRLKPLQTENAAKHTRERHRPQKSDITTTALSSMLDASQDQGKQALLVTVTSPKTPAAKNPVPPDLQSLSRLLKEKTQGLNLSENILTEVQEMSKHLSIVNWLLEPRRPQGQVGSTALKKVPGKESLNVPSSLNNLVMVRQGSLNWFDVPRQFLVNSKENEELHDHDRDHCPTRLSVHSELLSDDEEEIRKINFDILSM